MEGEKLCAYLYSVCELLVSTVAVVAEDLFRVPEKVLFRVIIYLFIYFSTGVKVLTSPASPSVTPCTLAVF